MIPRLLLAQRDPANDPTNKWLAEHPAVLGGGTLAIGALLAGWGIVELKRGVARDKYGNEFNGWNAAVMAIARLVFGLAACGFGIYKMVSG